MMLKKMFLVMCLVMLVGAGTALADGGNDAVNGSGVLAVGAYALGGDIKTGTDWIPNGHSAGLNAGGGASAGVAGGFIYNGTISADLTVIGGGEVQGGPRNEVTSNADKFISVGSQNTAYGVTGGSLHIVADPGKGFGMVAGTAGGIAGEATLSHSALSESPRRFWTMSEGNTLGIAGQAAVGAWSGEAGVLSGPDYTKYSIRRVTRYYGGEPGGRGYYQHKHGQIQYFRNGHPENQSEWTFLGRSSRRGYECVRIPVDSNGQAGFHANIFMTGGSFSESYRFVDWENGQKTEGMGTFVGAGTNVYATGGAYSSDNGLAIAGADVNGGYKVIGGAVSFTTQETKTGKAGAFAAGAYKGSGGLNTQYQGNAFGGTHTTATQTYGMTGSVMTSSAHMTVTSNGSSIVD